MEFDQTTTMQLQTLGYSRIITKPFTEKDLINALSETIDNIEKKVAA
jgi:YesN/AraC family two-component response regulator